MGTYLLREDESGRIVIKVLGITSGGDSMETSVSLEEIAEQISDDSLCIVDRDSVPPPRYAVLERDLHEKKCDVIPTSPSRSHSRHPMY